jgi:hypothetical protein
MGVVRTWVKEDRYEDAMKVADSYLRRYPSGKHRAAIAYYRGWLPYDQRRCDEAVPALRSYVTSYGDRSSYVRGFIAWCAIREEKWEQAIRDYEVLVNYGGALTRGKAWVLAGRGAGRAGPARGGEGEVREDPSGLSADLVRHPGPAAARALGWPRPAGVDAAVARRRRRGAPGSPAVRRRAELAAALRPHRHCLRARPAAGRARRGQPRAGGVRAHPHGGPARGGPRAARRVHPRHGRRRRGLQARLGARQRRQARGHVGARRALERPLADGLSPRLPAAGRAPRRHRRRPARVHLLDHAPGEPLPTRRWSRPWTPSAPSR